MAIFPPMPDAPIAAALPAKPLWLRAWAASHTRAVSYDLAALRRRASCLPHGVTDMMRTHPVDSIVRCLCGDRRCVGYAIVCGVATVGEASCLLLRGSPTADPFLAPGMPVEVVFVGGGVTPEQYDALARGRLGLC